MLKNFLGDISGRFSDFRTVFLRLELEAFRGNFVLQRCRPNLREFFCTNDSAKLSQLSQTNSFGLFLHIRISLASGVHTPKNDSPIVC